MPRISISINTVYFFILKNTLFLPRTEFSFLESCATVPERDQIFE